jgi:hypothetical protein
MQRLLKNGKVTMDGMIGTGKISLQRTGAIVDN